MKTESLILSSVLIMVPIIISYKEKLELNRDIIVSMLRAVVQLLAVGYILDVIFGLDKLIYTVILVLVMIINAAINTKKKGFTIESQVLISFTSISVGTIITLGILISSKAIGYTPNEVIPVAGMIISNSMVAIGLSYRNLINNFKNNSIAVEVKLSLGASIKEASDEIIRESIKISIMPTIDSAKTLGIVSLPGMMTGLILAGASPLVAVKFQIMVTFMILSSSSIATIMATYLSYKKFFNKRKQLKQIVA
ncbi:ABC transporter permease [Terrisporobacter glycolicus]|uniref:Iron export permease protein FetB n=1 Tax=Terrisporobacter glycolicus ATCC 14880 = DSM 1288 TaxID=1121315 RepID=A0ABZ2EZV7_9FIRM|nr:iron export ABC transporter permease subunit FetB [Terrisporobacter glycolicus]